MCEFHGVMCGLNFVIVEKQMIRHLKQGKNIAALLNVINYHVYVKCLVNPITYCRKCLFFIKYKPFSSFEAGNCVSNSSFR